MSKISRIRRRGVVAVLAATTALASAACGGSGGSSNGASASGGTIKLGLITSVGTRVDFTDVLAFAKAAAVGINDRGGIDGKKVEIDFCNENLDPNQGRACARKLVGDGIMAMAGGAFPTSEKDVDALLSAAGIVNFGPWSYSSATATDPNTYLLQGGQIFMHAACVRFGVQDGRTRLATALQDNPINTEFGPLYKDGTKQEGGELVGQVSLPPTAGDFAPQASQLVSLNPDIISIHAAGPILLNVLPALNGLGYKGKWITQDAGLATSDIGTLGANMNNGILVGPFPPLSAAADFPGLQQFQKDVELARKAGVANLPAADATFVRSTAMNTYFAVIATAKIANDAKATDAKSFKAAVPKVKNLDLGGVIPPWTASESASKVVPRTPNGNFYAYHFENGAPVLDTKKSVDLSDLVDKYIPAS